MAHHVPSPHEGLEAAKRSRWLRHCLPIISQAKHDAEGNALVCLFAEFADDNRTCEVNLVYFSEASWNRKAPLSLNHVGTFFYRTWNRAVYGRTADIKRITFHQVNIDFDFASAKITKDDQHRLKVDSNSVLPWHHVTSPDFSFAQSFRAGDAVHCCFCGFEWFAFYKHYAHSQTIEDWSLLESYRPLLHLNTCNHMFSPHDNNPDLPKHMYTTYPVLKGSRATAEIFGRHFVPNRPHLWMPCLYARAQCCAVTSAASSAPVIPLPFNPPSLHLHLSRRLGNAWLWCMAQARHTVAFILGTASGEGADTEVAAAEALERKWARASKRLTSPSPARTPQALRTPKALVQEPAQPSLTLHESEIIVIEATAELSDDDDSDDESETNGDSDRRNLLNDLESIAIGYPMDSPSNLSINTQLTAFCWPPIETSSAFTSSFPQWRRVQYRTDGSRHLLSPSTTLSTSDFSHDDAFSTLPKSVVFFTHGVWAADELPASVKCVGHPFWDAGQNGTIMWTEFQHESSIISGIEPEPRKVGLAAVGPLTGSVHLPQHF